jgi:hypothetical protein
MAVTGPAAMLDPFQAAVLCGGAARACMTAIVSLADRGLLRSEPPTQFSGRFFAEGALPDGAHPLERAVHAAAAQPHAPAFAEVLHDWELRQHRRRGQTGQLSQRQREMAQRRAERGPMLAPAPGASTGNLHRAARQPTADLRQELRQLGLLRPRNWPPFSRFAATDRFPATDGMATAAASCSAATKRTPAGRDAVAELRRCYLPLKQAAGATAQPALAVAIWGLGVLWDTPLRDLKEAISPEVTFGSG